jgi:hypothetical protein
MRDSFYPLPKLSQLMPDDKYGFMSRVTPEDEAMTRLFTKDKLERENQAFCGTPGVSNENRCHGFRPAFHDTETGRVEISCFLNGQPAPMHMIEGLPESWIVERDAASNATAIKQSVIAGFVREGCFYTRSQAADTVLAETTQCPVFQAEPACG